MLVKFLKVFAIVAVVMLAVSVDASAQNNAVFDVVIKKGVDLFTEVRTVVFVMGGFGLVGLAVASIFGRPMWKWFALLALGLVVVAVANAIINYFASSDGTSSNNRIKFNDTLN
jgi:TrbC/VIRB2 family.